MVSLLPVPVNTENKHLLFTDSVAKIITQNDIQVSLPPARFPSLANGSSQFGVLLLYNIKRPNKTQNTKTRNPSIRSCRRTRI